MRIDEAPKEISILNLLKVVWQGKWLIVAITVIAVAAMFLFNLLIPPVPIYKEWARVQTTEGNNFGRAGIVGRILHSDEFVEAVASKIDGYSNEELFEVSQTLLTQSEFNFETVVDESTVVSPASLMLTMQGTDPDLMHIWFSTALDELQKRSEEHYVQRQEIKGNYLETLRIQMTAINNAIEEAQKRFSTQPDQADIGSLAELLQSQERVSREEYRLRLEMLEDQAFNILTAPRKQTELPPASLIRPNLVVAGCLGLLLGIVLVFLRDYIKSLRALKSLSIKGGMGANES